MAKCKMIIAIDINEKKFDLGIFNFKFSKKIRSNTFVYLIFTLVSIQRMKNMREKRYKVLNFIIIRHNN